MPRTQDYYLRAQPTFETPVGKHDWLTRHVFVGVGERRPDGNPVSYYALTWKDRDQLTSDKSSLPAGVNIAHPAASIVGGAWVEAASGRTIEV